MGWSTRANFGFDFASNTGYGPLIGHFDVNIDVGNGLDPLQYGTANIAYLNQGYLTWAGITAGKAPSFFSFIGGGDNWANIFSPDQRGFNEPMLLAYTASFGGGFSATLAAQSPGTEGSSGGGTDMTGGYFNTNSGPNPGQFNATNITFGGQRWPDIVGALHVKQGWGEAQMSGVLHDVNVSDNVYNGAVRLRRRRPGRLQRAGKQDGLGHRRWREGLPAVIRRGRRFRPHRRLYPERDLVLRFGDGMWSELGATNGNGQPMYPADAYFNPLTNSWAKPTAWSITGILEHHFTPQFYVNLEGSVLGLTGATRAAAPGQWSGRVCAPAA